MKIYICHSSLFDYNTDLYVPLRQSDLNQVHEFVLPHESSDQQFSSKKLFHQGCDLVIAEISYPSTGMGIELGWADELGIPIYAVYRAKMKPCINVSDSWFCAILTPRRSDVKPVTLLYLLRQGDSLEVCLARKKTGHVVDRLNAAGGHVEDSDAGPAETAQREIWEEQKVRVRVEDLKLAGEVHFIFPRGEHEDQLCLVYTTRVWRGEPQETAALGPPEWYEITNLPLDRLPPADAGWLEQVLRGECMRVVCPLDRDFRPIADITVECL